jgi:UDP-N-acetyl-2-amino-2-deoxyglucuronate dehydrogenase
MKNFAITGVAGFVAPRHLKAIRDTGNNLLAALDPHDSVGILDSFFPEAYFFTSTERLERFLVMLRNRPEEERVHYVSICAPNHVHDAHIRMALWVGADAICEKPLVINPWNLDPLQALEHQTGKRAYTVLQLRLLPTVRELKQKLDEATRTDRSDVVLTYVTRRGHWYHHSWKGQEERSGGLAMNIGIHFFDLLLWLFGSVEKSTLHLYSPARAAGVLELERAHVRWFLSIDGDDLPEECKASGRHAFRSISLDGEEFELSHGFTNLHTQVYENILAGHGSGIDEARPSIELVYAIRTSEVQPPGRDAHPMLRTG